MGLFKSIFRGIGNIWSEVTGSRKKAHEAIDAVIEQNIAAVSAEIAKLQAADLARLDADFAREAAVILTAIERNNNEINQIPNWRAKAIALIIEFKDAVHELAASVDPVTGLPIEAEHLPCLSRILADPEKLSEFEYFPIPVPNADGKVTFTYPFQYAMVQFHSHKRPAAVRLMLSKMDYLLEDGDENFAASILLPKTTTALHIFCLDWTAEELAKRDALRQQLINERVLPDLLVALASSDLVKIKKILDLEPTTLVNAILPGKDGANLLIEAVKQCKREVVKLLLNEKNCYEIDILKTDLHNKTALAYAIETRNQEIITILENTTQAAAARSAARAAASQPQVSSYSISNFSSISSSSSITSISSSTSSFSATSATSTSSFSSPTSSSIEPESRSAPSAAGIDPVVGFPSVSDVDSSAPEVERIAVSEVAFLSYLYLAYPLSGIADEEEAIANAIKIRDQLTTGEGIELAENDETLTMLYTGLISILRACYKEGEPTIFERYSIADRFTTTAFWDELVPLLQPLTKLNIPEELKSTVITVLQLIDPEINLEALRTEPNYLLKAKARAEQLLLIDTQFSLPTNEDIDIGALIEEQINAIYEMDLPAILAKETAAYLDFDVGHALWQQLVDGYIRAILLLDNRVSALIAQTNEHYDKMEKELHDKKDSLEQSKINLDKQVKEIRQKIIAGYASLLNSQIESIRAEGAENKRTAERKARQSLVKALPALVINCILPIPSPALCAANAAEAGATIGTITMEVLKNAMTRALAVSTVNALVTGDLKHLPSNVVKGAAIDTISTIVGLQFLDNQEIKNIVKQGSTCAEFIKFTAIQTACNQSLHAAVNGEGLGVITREGLIGGASSMLGAKVSGKISNSLPIKFPIVDRETMGTVISNATTASIEGVMRGIVTEGGKPLKNALQNGAAAAMQSMAVSGMRAMLSSIQEQVKSRRTTEPRAMLLQFNAAKQGSASMQPKPQVAPLTAETSARNGIRNYS